MEGSGPQIDDGQIAKVLDAALEQADAHRTNALGVAGDLTSARAASLGLELERVKAVYGADSPEATEITNRLDLQGVVVKTVVAEGQRAQIAPPTLDAKTATIMGRVVDAAAMGIPNYTVSAVDDGDTVLTYGCSDVNGAFLLLVPAPSAGGSTDTGAAAGSTSTLAAASAELLMRLRVTDEQQRIRFQDTAPMTVFAQKLYYRELQVQDPSATCAPPKDPAKPTTKSMRKPPGNPPIT